MKKIKELNKEEFKKLLKQNKALFSEACEHASDDAYFWAGEFLAKCPKNVYYSFITYEKVFNVSVFDYELYYYVKKLQSDFCLFEDGEKLLRKIEKAISLYEKTDNQYSYGINDKNAKRIEKRLEEIKEEIEEEIASAIYSSTYELCENKELIIELAFENDIFDEYEVDEETGKAYRTIRKEYK